MIARRFEYIAPGSPAEAVQLLARDPERTQILAGGTWLVPDMNRGLARPATVVDLRATGLDALTLNDGHLRIGAMCTYGDLMRSSVAARASPLLVEMARGITGGAQLTDQATVGGSAVAARVGSDAPGALMAVGAGARVLGPTGERTVAARDFWVGARNTALASDELLLGFEVEAVGDRSWAYEKVKRSYGSWPILVAGAVVERGGDGAVTAAQLTVGGAAPQPVLVEVADLLAEGASATACAEAGRRARAAIEVPWGDELAPAGYRSRIVAPVAARVLARAVNDVTPDLKDDQ